MTDLAALRRRHDLLYEDLLKAWTPVPPNDGPPPAKPAALDAETRTGLVRRMDALLEELEAVPAEELTHETWDWLSTALLNWQVASATLLDEPREIEIPHRPGAVRSGRSQRALTDEEIEGFLSEKAHQLSMVRKAGELMAQLERIRELGSTRRAIAQDWRGAKAFFAYQLISGERSLTSQLTAGSFHHFADVWLDEVKEVWAFLLWKGRGSPEEADPDRDYLDACRELANRLGADAARKGSLKDFLEAEDLLNRDYLVDGRVEIVEPRPTAAAGASLPPIGPGERLWTLVRDKAMRRALLAGRGDPEADWRIADRQVREFYGSIVPAVKDRAPSATHRVLRALYGCEPIVTALEAALAVYFLDGELVGELLGSTRPPAPSVD